MAESRKRAPERGVKEVAGKLVRVELGNETNSSNIQQTIMEEPVVSNNEHAEQPDEEPIRGIEEFNPNYIKREPETASESDSDELSLSNEEETEEDAADSNATCFTLKNKQTLEGNYLSTFTFHPNKPTADLPNILEELERPISEQWKDLLGKHKFIKVYIVMHGDYQSLLNDKKETSDLLHTQLMPLLSVVQIPHLLATLNQELISKCEKKLGFILKQIRKITVGAAEHLPLPGSTFHELPLFLLNKKCVVNVKNSDNRCFGYALLASLEPSPHNQNNPRSYNQHFSKHNLDTLPYPIKLGDIAAIDAYLPYAINVFGFDDDAGRKRFPIYVSHKAGFPSIDLIYWNQHFALIKNFNRFMADIKKFHGRQHFCRRCYAHFWKESTLNNHQSNCMSI